MKIWFFSDVAYPFTYGGSELRIYELARRFVRKGNEVTVYCVKWFEGSSHKDVDGIKYYGICKPYSLYSRKGQRNPIGAFKYVMYLIFTLAKLKDSPNIVDCNQPPILHCLVMRLYTWLKRITLIVTWHEFRGKEWLHAFGLVGILVMIFEILILRTADSIITISRKQKQDMINVGVHPSKIHVIPPGINLSEIEPIKPEQIEKYDLIFVGRLVEEKHVDRIIKILPIILKHKPQCKVSIVGNGPCLGHIMDLARSLRVDDHVRFFGLIHSHAHVISIIKSSRLFIYPTSPEGSWAISILEAFACGVPAVIFEDYTLGTGSEIVINQYNGFLIIYNSIEQIGKEVAEALSNRGLCNQLSQNALIFARDYDNDILAERVLNIYRNFLKKKQKHVRY